MAVNINIDLPIEHKTPEGAHDFSGETAFVEFHKGAQLEGYVIVFDEEIKDYVHRDFNITFHTNSIDVDIHEYYITTSKEVESFSWNERTNMFYACGDIEFAVHLNSAKLYVETTLALKTENEELRTKRAALESRIAALEKA